MLRILKLLIIGLVITACVIGSLLLIQLFFLVNVPQRITIVLFCIFMGSLYDIPNMVISFINSVWDFKYD